MRCIALTTLVLGATLRAAAQLVDPAKSAANIAQREDATASATHLNRFNGHVVRSRRPLITHETILTHDPQFVLDFNAEVCVGEGAGRDIVAASLADFPFLGDQRMSLGVGEMTYVLLSISISHRREPLSTCTGPAECPGLTTTRLPLDTSTQYPDQTLKLVSSEKTGPNSSSATSTLVM